MVPSPASIEPLPPPSCAGARRSAAAPGISRSQLALSGYDVTLLDPSQAMLTRPGTPWRRCPLGPATGDAPRADGEKTPTRQRAACASPPCCPWRARVPRAAEPLVSHLCQVRAAAVGVVSIMTGNAREAASTPSLERLCDDALARSTRGPRSGSWSPTGSRHGEELSETLLTAAWSQRAGNGGWAVVDWLDSADPS